MDIVQIIADILSVITISLCLILKIPQIINIVKLKSAVGINLLSLLLDLTSYTIMTSYNFVNEYALLSFMEYPILLVQQVILIFFVLKYMNLLGVTSFAGFGVYLSIFAAFIFGVIPKTVLTFLAPMTTPVSASSKVVQLLEILRSKNSASVSILTWFLSAFTNFNRLLTSLILKDTWLTVNHAIQASLIVCILMCICVYKPSPQEKQMNKQNQAMVSCKVFDSL